MVIIFAFDTRYICRIDPTTNKSVLNPYTPVEFSFIS